jgi:pimeloyl-ACP methyl ester carboxylesterase
VRFVELTYPRTITWSLVDHASGVLEKLRAHDIREGWVLAESFGSLVAWEIIGKGMQGGFAPKGLILCGGFVRYPSMITVRTVSVINRRVPLALIKLVCWFYGRYAVVRHRRAPETLEGAAEFVRRRSEEADRAAICHRYGLIMASDAREVARSAALPVYQLCGFVDPIVPWWPVRRWLKRHCSAYGGWRMVWNADHNVLGTAPQVAAEQVLAWMGAGQLTRGQSSR